MPLWTPANLLTPPRYVFDPGTFVYTGSNFTSGSNSGSVGGAWSILAGTPAKGAGLNGFNTLGFAGAQSFINSTATWPAGNNFFVFHVSSVGTTNGGGLVSHSWGVGDVRDATHGMVYYPRIGTAFGGSVNEGGIFQGISSGVITRGDVFTDTSFHIAATKTGTVGLLRKDGTVLSPTITTGTISLSNSTNFRVGSTDNASEFLTGDVAYIAVLVDPTTPDIQNLEGWAAWNYGLVAQLDAGHPYKSAAPFVNVGGNLLPKRMVQM